MKTFRVALIATAPVSAYIEVEAEDANDAKTKALGEAKGPQHQEKPQRFFWDTDSDGSGIDPDSIQVEYVEDFDDIEDHDSDY